MLFHKLSEPVAITFETETSYILEATCRFHVKANSDVKTASARWEVHGSKTHNKGHRDVANTQLLHVIEHGEDILSFKSFDNDFLSAEGVDRLVFAPLTFDPKDTS